MASKLDDLVPAIRAKNDAGLGLAAITKKFAGASKDGAIELRARLAFLVQEGAIWGPFKYRGSQLYFAAGRGPSVETASQAIVSLVSKSGVKLLSKPTLTKKVTGMNARLFPDGLKQAISSQAIMELSCGSSKYYLHRDVAADRFGFEAACAHDNGDRTEQLIPDASRSRLTLEEVLPAYRRLKAEQGGFSAVKIFDLMWPSWSR